MSRGSASGCFEKALELLARRPHFQDELSSKLLARNFSSSEIAATLKKLIGQGLVDDRRHALSLATGSMARKGYGPRRVRAELERRGVDSAVVEEVVAEVFASPDSELERAREVAHRRTQAGRIGRPALARHLDRRGFSKAVILRILEEIASD